ncbi:MULTISPECIES: RT0821/Lpp0805 family surface protein [Rhodomicrobium]|uniref:RT0821/Lpp0805 family surface protein n=1 Tax=Rhodomicrobium TaxID=1068 RepID=UPI000B4B0280|nr:MULTISPECIES: RT0821/Lpp0805 family surface protein [Rhodomicrobium]
MKLIRFLGVGALLLPLWACGPAGSHQEGGTVVGAVAGGIIGNQFGHGAGRVLATATGVVVGGLIGSSIGRDMDEADRRYALEAEYRALEDDDDEEWRNERSGHRGHIKPRRSYRSAGRTCREYEHTVYIDDRPQTMVGKACRQDDGTWKAVS